MIWPYIIIGIIVLLILTVFLLYRWANGEGGGFISDLLVGCGKAKKSIKSLWGDC